MGLKSTPKEATEGHGRKCQFVEQSSLASVTFFDSLGLDSVAASNQDVKPVPTVGRHKALQSMFGSTCGITMEITLTSAVDVTGGDIDGNKQKACDAAMRMARIVEPKLPGGS